MNDALQALEVKVENGGATPQGKVFAKEWNVLVEAVKALDLKEFDEAALHKFLQDNGYITEDNIPTTDLSDVVTLATEQAISGRKNFVGGVEVNGQELVYDAEKKVWQLTGDLVVTGAVTMFGTDATIPSSIWANIPFNPEQMSWDGSQWNISGGGSGSVNEATVNNLIYEYLTQNSYAKISDISSALTGYATQSWVEGKKYLTGITSSMVTTALGYTPYNSANFTKTNIKTALGISDWALAATKPSYTAAEVGALSISGGSVSSDDYQPLFVNSNFSSGIEDVRIAIAHNWNVKGLFNWESNGVGLRMYNTACGSAIGIKDDGTPYYDSYTLIHSGNIGSYNSGSATKLQTARTIWGQSFDGTENISGLLTDVYGIRGSETDGGYIGDRNKGLGVTEGGSMIYNYSYSPITFHIAGFERMRITANSNVAIGGTTADAKLHVHGDAKIGGVLNITSNNTSAIVLTDSGRQESSIVFKGLGGNEWYVGKGVGGINDFFGIYNAYKGNALVIDNNSDVTIYGNLLASGAITMFSQASMKNVIDYDGLSLAQLAQIRPARFTWKDGRDNRIHVGCIADYIQPILPEVVYETVNNELTVDYGSSAFYIGASLIKPVVELWKAKDKQQQKIEALEKRVEYLENENRQLRAS